MPRRPFLPIPDPAARIGRGARIPNLPLRKVKKKAETKLGQSPTGRYETAQSFL
jgi:hypothetical protein